MRVVISGIGTGGHYFPALVVGEEFMRRRIPVLFLARRGHREEALARERGIPVFCTDPRGFYGKSLKNKIISIVSIMASIIMVSRVTNHVIGLAFGGYGSLPLIIACMVNRCPFYVFEPNRIPGRATTLFAGKARRIFLGLPLAKGVHGRSIVTGIPIRQEFKNDRAPSAKKKELKKILFIGGSQGARRLNDLAIALQNIRASGYQITIISGTRDHDRVKKLSYGTTRVVAFTEEPWHETAKADIIVSRSGALAGYEIMSSGKPVIFIPFPHAIDDHQYHNAHYFSRVGNALVLREGDADEQTVAHHIDTMVSKKGRGSGIIWDAEKRIVTAIVEDNDL
ncbi:glycosyltransferase [candidate division WOR-3 bacterium]|nr:glycosyltransferase [candidate division WOR-3 bacterium]